MKYNIVLIEDNLVLLECYHQILVQFGFNVLALDSISNENLILNFDPDLIISDLYLGYGNDSSVFDFLKKFYIQKKIPLILVTGNSEFNHGVFDQLGLVGDVLIKPISIEVLINTVKKNLII